MQHRTCVYCGKRLSLFLYLAGEPRFCSPDHRARYHSEMERLALESLHRAEQAANDRLVRGVSEAAQRTPAAVPQPDPEPVPPPIATHIAGPMTARAAGAETPRLFLHAIAAVLALPCRAGALGAGFAMAAPLPLLLLVSIAGVEARPRNIHASPHGRVRTAAPRAEREVRRPELMQPGRTGLPEPVAADWHAEPAFGRIRKSGPSLTRTLLPECIATPPATHSIAAGGLAALVVPGAPGAVEICGERMAVEWIASLVLPDGRARLRADVAGATQVFGALPPVRPRGPIAPDRIPPSPEWFVRPVIDATKEAAVEPDAPGLVTLLEPLRPVEPREGCFPHCTPVWSQWTAQPAMAARCEARIGPNVPVASSLSMPRVQWREGPPHFHPAAAIDRLADLNVPVRAGAARKPHLPPARQAAVAPRPLVAQQPNPPAPGFMPQAAPGLEIALPPGEQGRPASASIPGLADRVPIVIDMREQTVRPASAGVPHAEWTCSLPTFEIRVRETPRPPRPVGAPPPAESMFASHTDGPEFRPFNSGIPGLFIPGIRVSALRPAMSASKSNGVS